MLRAGSLIELVATFASKKTDYIRFEGIRGVSDRADPNVPVPGSKNAVQFIAEEALPQYMAHLFRVLIELFQKCKG